MVKLTKREQKFVRMVADNALSMRRGGPANVWMVRDSDPMWLAYALGPTGGWPREAVELFERLTKD